MKKKKKKKGRATEERLHVATPDLVPSAMQGAYPDHNVTH